jgi:hypothetical protein
MFSLKFVCASNHFVNQQKSFEVRKLKRKLEFDLFKLNLVILLVHLQVRLFQKCCQKITNSNVQFKIDIAVQNLFKN